VVFRISQGRPAFHHFEFDGLASLANVLGKDRAFLDALEDLLGREQH
jgi:hypothetical protein